MWHAEITGLVLRHYTEEGGYELMVKFDAVAYAKTCGPNELFIEGALRTDGKPLSIGDWRALGDMLHKRFGVLSIKATRAKKKDVVSFRTTRSIN